MNVIIQIHGREAIPVRAIPLLANWRFMTPDVVAHVLGGTTGSNASLFGNLESYRMEDGQVQPIRHDWWTQFPLRRLQALTKQIAAAESIYEVGYSEWQEQSLKELPAGAFVWKDDYQDLHEKNWNSQHDVLLRGLQCLNSQDDADATFPYTNLTSEKLADDSSLPDDMRESIEILKRWHEGNLPTLLADGVSLTLYLRESMEILKRWRVPEYCPFIDASMRDLVMDGFENSGPVAIDVATPATTTTPAPVATDQTKAVETVEKRRARYLDWFIEEERIAKRGALQRVYEREAKQNPKADRSNIGKDIKKARCTAKTQKQTNAWTSQLITDGKRKG